MTKEGRHGGWYLLNKWEFSKVKKANRTNEGDDRLKNRKMDRNPGEKARGRMRRPAYALGKLSFQARRLIRHQGCQMEHESVDQYVRRQEHGRV